MRLVKCTDSKWRMKETLKYILLQGFDGVFRLNKHFILKTTMKRNFSKSFNKNANNKTLGWHLSR